MNKARFPGKSVNKHKRPTVSFSDLNDHTIATGISGEYREAMARIMTELPALRDQFLDDGPGGQEEFHGFSPNDKLQSVCHKKRAELKSLLSKFGNKDLPTIPVVVGKVNGFSSNNIEEPAAARARSKRIADRGTGPTKRKYIFESPEEYKKEVISAWVKVDPKPNDPFKTPVKVDISVSSPVEIIENKLPTKAHVDVATKIETSSEKLTDKRAIVTSAVTGTVQTTSNASTVISNDFFKEKEDYVASVIVLTESRVNLNYESLKQVKGLIHCGVCLSIAECDNLGPQRKNGAFLCMKCIDFLQKMIKIAKKANAFSCRGQGSCEIVPETEYCEACFVRSCLLLLDMNDELYFKMWRAVPPLARNFVPTKPPVVKRYPNRGKVLYVNAEDGSILSICSFKSSRSENSNGTSVHTNGKSKGVKRLFPNDDTSLSRVTGPRVKQVSRRVTERPPIATFGDAMELRAKNDLNGESNKEMLLDRLEMEQKRIKFLCPLESYNVERYGFPIIVPEGEELPNKPLCFVCGSAGIKQLIFCSACCEPFHPYCADDSLLLSAFIIESVKENKNEEIEIVTDCNCKSDYQNLCSSCTPALRMFRRWKCIECIRCKSCQKGKNPCKMANQDDFLKCLQCHDSYHFSCVKKMTSVSVKTNEADKWMCQNCLKCTSCGVRLSKSFQNNFRKLSTDDNGNCLEREMLCLECFKRRQNGSFCPICLVCYDDNDWDSKMMECDRCNRWIHSKCEGLNDEQYFILSSLPETVSYICRLCYGPENEVGWRQAVKAEFADGFTKALDIFQKKVVGMSRKRRALTFEEEETPYFKPNVNPIENETPIDIIIISNTAERIEVKANSQSVKTTKIPEVNDEFAELFIKHNLKHCVIKLFDMDITKHSPPPIPIQNRKSRRSGTNKTLPDLIPIKIERETTPIKVYPAVKLETENHKIIPTETTPIKISTPTRIVTSFTDSIRSMGNFWTSVADFRGVCLKLIPSYFLEMGSESTTRFEEYFEDSVKQVFPWFTHALELKEFSPNTTSSSFETDLNVDTNRESSPLLTKADIETIITDEIISESNVFEDVFWNPDNFMDYRECLLCGEIGDYPPDSCGRLLFVGPAEWVHVNCAIWSSEVWEEETGALQQVEVALGRGKRVSCDFCDNSGATLNCCAATCRRCYHFLCAKEAGCSLMEDKTVFCPGHEATARGQIQTDMHVMRKVFVDLDMSRKKEMRLLSTEIKIFIGSMRVDQLGQLFPISSLKTNSSRFLVPVGYKSGRLFWSLPIPKQLDLCWLETSIKREGDFRTTSEIVDVDTVEPYSIVIDHAKRKDLVQSKLEEVQHFLHWVNSAPRFIDEFNIEWLLPYSSSMNFGRNLKTHVRKNGLKRKKFNGVKTHCPNSTSYPLVINRATIEWEVNGRNRKFSEYGVGKPCRCYVSDKIHFPSGIFTTYPEESLFFGEASEKSYDRFIKKIGLLHPGIRFLMEQLPGVEGVAGNYDFRYHNPIVSPEDTPVHSNASGCARTEGFMRRKPFDMFGWLASRHRKAPAPLRMFEETVKCKGLPIAMRFRNLKERAIKDLVVLPSHIHGRGLFARRDIEMGEMLIEYAGEAIRSPVCDVRERKYENEGMGCYMFRIDRDLVIDATMKGNAARFINHSCDPNCESKSVKILGKGHILIFALKNIGRGEELTYDYKFEREADKLPCSCSAKKCRKFLN